MAKELFAIVMALLAACSSGGGGHDAGDGGQDAADARDGEDGRSDLDIPADLDLGDGFGLWVPQGARLCSMGAWSNGLQQMLELREITNRFELAPGLVSLPREGALPQIDWIQSIEMGPGRLVPTKAGPGVFERSVYAGDYFFKYTQSFSAEGKPLEIVLGAYFPAGQNLLVLDPAQLGGDVNQDNFYVRGEIEVGGNPRRLVYTTCDTAALSPATIDAVIEGGSSLELLYRCPQWSGFVILSTICPCLIESARYVTAGGERLAEDFFDLLNVSYNHCNINQATLLFLPEPLDGATGLFARGGAMPMAGQEPTELTLLDAAGQPLGTKKIESWKRR